MSSLRLAAAVALSLALALAGCTAPKPQVPPPPPPTPAPALPPPAPPPPPSDWRDAPLTAGSWNWTADARGSVALFGTRGEDALLVIRCDVAQRRISLSRRDATPPGGAASLTITTSFGARTLPAPAVAGATPPYLGAALIASDPLLDQIAFSRGRIMVTTPGMPRLLVPIWAEAGRVIEDCRG